MTFEVRSWDAAGRLGELEVPRAGVTVETPALLPVVNPHVQTIEPARLGDEFGAEMLITNAYVLWGSDDLREDAEERGVHDMLGFDGAVMTDSGSFQLAEYGDIDVGNREILRFQRTIGSDVATPVDVPTPPDADRERAADELATTKERLEVAAGFDAGDVLVNAPVQGSTHLDLRTAAAEHAAGTGLDVFPVGAVVPLMNAYRYGDVAEVVGAAKRGLPLSAPVHLFGAGHPMMFALAVALGCDLFDSAAYALYANDDRYLTVRGTHHLADLDYLPCDCPVCARHGADGLAALDDAERRDRLAEHNLHVSFGELRRVKQAIRDGNLLELVETRARAHPTMLDGYRAALEDADRLAATDPASKGTLFYCSGESAARPEVRRHHERLDRLSPPGDLLLAPPDAGAPAGDHDATWRLVPPFGPVPPALSETYPLTAELPNRVDDRARAAAVEGVRALADAHPETTVTVAHVGWSPHLLAALPEDVDAVDVAD
jgi:7-cyano-7-deazaguanine tRNA-ribosyltransferase